MEKPEIISYQALRKIVGMLGIAFPVGLVLGSIVLGSCEWSDIQGSISGYYHTVMRDVFVGTLCVVAFFLYAYRGYNHWADILASRAACVFALGVAFFPTSMQDEPRNACTRMLEPAAKWVGTVHYVSAALLFATFTVFSLLLFTKTDGDMTPEKEKRNLIFRICGVVMALCIVLLGLYFAFFERTSLRNYKPVFWLEAIALWAFGISWLTKGEFIFKDKLHHSASTQGRPRQPLPVS
ncbi:hypothetical protein [Hymenobacter arizonensis]|uniref:DUF998 domain-containing protein n=1 Tax=Hymenobacter arizonensis TaxID=1227077 RepID=A0A1I6AIR8_HYMAR|nr:hypothetical protein [Hymenobacter arizonensis]SFQ68562.1 hypothetical protein SAMN04515668_3726 [Hymenobacter arizonensis]